jgi:hypothetical protein
VVSPRACQGGEYRAGRGKGSLHHPARGAALPGRRLPASGAPIAVKLPARSFAAPLRRRSGLDDGDRMRRRRPWPASRPAGRAGGLRTVCGSCGKALSTPSGRWLPPRAG